MTKLRVGDRASHKHKDEVLEGEITRVSDKGHIVDFQPDGFDGTMRLRSTMVKKLPKYPEHEKVKRVKSQSQEIGNFIEWLRENKMQICFFEETTRGDQWWPTNKSIEQLLADYFDIDLKKIDKEKDEMLDEMRSETVQEEADRLTDCVP